MESSDTPITTPSTTPSTAETTTTSTDGSGSVADDRSAAAVKTSLDVMLKQSEDLLAKLESDREENVRQLRGMLTLGFVDTVATLLKTSVDDEELKLALQVMGNLLEAAKQVGGVDQEDMMAKVEALDGISSLERLQEHGDMEVYQAANDLIDKYFAEEFEEGDMPHPPPCSDMDDC